MEISALLDQMHEGGNVDRIVNNPLAQFGTPQKPYLFATLLPERTVKKNIYREKAIKFKTIIANDPTRYSPVQLKSGLYIASFLVELGNSDIGSELTADDYDAFLEVVRAATGSDDNLPTMEAVAQLTRWVDATLALPLAEKRELQRAQAICDASVIRKGDNGFTEIVQLSNPAGHRVNSGGDWDDADYPIYDDITAGIELLAGKGYTPNRIITSATNRARMSKNNDIKDRCGKIKVDGAGNLTTASGRASLAQINAMFSDDGLPPMEMYNTQYHTQIGSFFFMPRTDFIIAATTGREPVEVETPGDDENIMLEETLGYTAIGLAAGQNEPKVVTNLEAFKNKPPRMEGESWQTSFPVQTEPEAIYRIRAN